jgi:cysteinyl-tRNA synthetase
MVPDITPQQKALIQNREIARDAKDWARSDACRDELAAEGIGLRDHDGLGPTWYYL